MDLIIIRGLPGVGKTLVAKSIEFNLGLTHFEADQYPKNNVYGPMSTFEATAERLKEAHSWCQENCQQALESRRGVVVANVFYKLHYIRPYILMGMRSGARITVIHIIPSRPPTKFVGRNVYDRMLNEWEQCPGETSLSTDEASFSIEMMPDSIQCLAEHHISEIINNKIKFVDIDRIYRESQKLATKIGDQNENSRKTYWFWK